MKNLTIIMICLLCAMLLSCAMLHKSKKTTEKNADELASSVALDQSTNTQKALKSEMLSFYTDSADHQYQVQLWPKGKFTFSATNGFTGEADRLLLSGHLKGVKNGGSIATVDNKENTKARLKVKARASAKSKQSASMKKTAPSIWWIVAALLLLSAGVITLMKLKY
jgi:hypothetical protein